MKFEHLLKIYWSKGLYYNGKLYKLNWDLKEMFQNLAGLANKIQNNFIKRFEISYFLKNKQKTFSFININIEKKKILNMYLSQLTNTNNNIHDLIRYNLIRLYLIKSFRGRSHMLGKPSRGQRTWSNAWNAYKCNKITRSFVNEIIKTNKIEKKIINVNYKILQKKIKKPINKIKKKKTIIKKNLWF